MVKRTILIVFINLLYIPSLWAGSEVSAQDSVALDPSIRYGRLPNGFSYYIKHVPNAPKILMDLYVKVGSHHEDSDQMQFAHLLEHLAFKAATHFPVNLLNDPELRNRYGLERNDIRALTSVLYTKYYFNVRPGGMDAVDHGLLWFRDIADLELNTAMIHKERGPLRQEASFKVGDDINGFMLKTKLESELFPCRKDFSNFYSHNENFSPAALMQFYKDWYIPNRMGLVITGDLEDIDSIEQRIIKRFSDIPAKKSHPAMAVDCRSDYLQGPNRFVSLERKKEKMLKNRVAWHLYFKDRGHFDQNNTVQGIKRNVFWSILATMINNRIQKDSSVAGIGIAPDSDKPYFDVSIVDYDGSSRQKLQKIVQLLHQAKVYGFTAVEWGNSQKEVLLQLRDTASASYWQEQMFQHFIAQEALPANKGTFVYNWLKQLTLEDINSYTGEYLSVLPNDIGIIASTDHKALSYTETQVRGWMRQAADAPIKPYIPPQTEDSRPLMSKEDIASLKKAKITDKSIKNNGVDELVLDNGVKVVLLRSKPSGLLKNRISIHGFSPYGASCYSEDDYFSAINAPSIVQEAGVGDFNGEKLLNILSETSFGGTVRPYINFDETGFRVNSTHGDLEKMLQLVYLYFNEPRDDTESFERWKKKERYRYLYPSFGLIYEDFDQAINEVLNDRSSVPLGTNRFKGIVRTEKEKAYTIFQDLYGNPSAFTFIISGDFSKESVVPLVQKYLGNLVNSGFTPCMDSDQVTEPLPKGPIYQEFSAMEMGTSYEMKSVQYSLQFVFRETKSLEWKERIKVKALGSLINSKLKELRYKKEAALYYFSAFGEYNRYLKSYKIGIFLDCVEDQLEWLREESKLMISEIKNDGFSRARFNQICRDILYPMYITKSAPSSTKNGIYEHYRYHDPLIDNVSIEQFVKSLTIEDIKKTARKYLKEEYMMEFVMRENGNDP